MLVAKGANNLAMSAEITLCARKEFGDRGVMQRREGAKVLMVDSGESWQIGAALKYTLCATSE